MYKNLDPLLHAPLRLAIVSYLMTHSKVSFKVLKEITEASSGNLSVQFKKLEEANYLRMEKSFFENFKNEFNQYFRKKLLRKIVYLVKIEK